VYLWDQEQQKVVKVDDGTVQESIASGKYLPFKGKMHVLAPDGTPGTIDAQDALYAFQNGYTFETSQMQAYRQLKEEHGDGMTAFLAGAARGLTLGGSDILLSPHTMPAGPTGSADEQIRRHQEAKERAEILQMLKEEHPGKSVVGEVAGMVVPTLLTGGSGLGARGAAAAATPAAGAGAAGRLVERGAARMLTKAGLDATKPVGRIVGRSLSTGAGGAAEGSLFGVGQMASEHALAGTDGTKMTAEELLAGAGLGAVLGGAAGGIFGGGLQTAGEATRLAKIKAGETAQSLVSLFEKSSGNEPAKGLRGMLERMIERGRKIQVKGMEFRWGHPEEDMWMFMRPGPEGEAARYAVWGPNASRLKASYVDDLTELHTRALEHTNAAWTESTGRLKTKSMDKLMKEHLNEVADELTRGQGLTREEAYNLASTMMRDNAYRQSTKIINDMAIVLDDLAEIPEVFAGRGFTGANPMSLRKQLNKYIDEIDDIYEGPWTQVSADSQLAKMHTVMDRLKREIAKPARRLAKLKYPHEAQTVAREWAIGEQGRAGGVYDEVEKFLENPNVWGRAGMAQKEVNQAYYNWLRWQRHALSGKFQMNVEGPPATDVVRGIWDTPKRGRREGFDEFSRAVGRGGEGEYNQFLLGQNEARRDFIRKIDEWYDLTPKGRKALADADQVTRDFEKTILNQRDHIARKNQFEDIVNATNEGKAGGRGLTGAIAGYAVGGSPGALFGIVAEELLDPVRSIRRLARLDALKRSFKEKAGGAVDRFIQKAKTGKPGGKAASRWRPPVGAVSFLVDFTLEPGKKKKRKETRADAVKRVSGEIARLQTDPEMLNARLARTIGETMDAAPETSMQMVGAATRAVAYMNRHMPTPPANTLNPLLSYEEWVPSDMECSEFENRMRAIDDPLSQLDELVNGTLSPEGAEALREVFPDLVQGYIVPELIGRIAELQEQLPKSDIVQLSLFVGMPLDETMQPDFIMQMQQNYATEDQAGAGAPRPKLPTPDLERHAEDMEARSEKLAELD